MHRAGGRIRPHQKVLLECIPLKRKHIAHDFDLLAIVLFDLTGENRGNDISIDVSSTQEVARRIYFSKKATFTVILRAVAVSILLDGFRDYARNDKFFNDFEPILTSNSRSMLLSVFATMLYRDKHGKAALFF